jgi:hypothetical protein
MRGSGPMGPGRKRRLLGLSIPMLLIGIAFLAGAYFSYVDENTGPEAMATVASCTGSYSSKVGSGVVCQGTWIVGGALVGGNGHVVFGDILDANYSDIGHTISVHLHGGDAYSTEDSVRVPVIFLVLALPGLYIGIRALVFGVPDSWIAKSRRGAAPV